MRYRLTPSAQSALAQVLTPPRLAQRVMDFLPGAQESWLELGVGSGRIANACLKARNPSAYVGVDVDEQLLSNAVAEPVLALHRANVLDPVALDQLLGGQMFTRVVGNPPYGIQAAPAFCQERISQLCPGISLVSPWVQLELYFVLESLARLRSGGSAAFVVGAALAEDERMRTFRTHLVQIASEVECYELPASVFDGDAEVQSYLLVARFGARKLKQVKIGRLVGEALELQDQQWISPEQAVQRLDLGHHEFQSWNSSLLGRRGVRTLQELGVTVVRGSRTRSQFECLGVKCFHTSDFPSNAVEVRFARSVDHGFQSAAAGDILLPRVGTRCLDRQAVVIKGARHYTEAVYRLRVPKRNQPMVAQWVLSELGARWRQQAAKGSCAKHLTVSSLMGMPVPASCF